jgi:hypothetical protein
MLNNRCVYAYIREVDDLRGKAGTPYYIGKGTIRRVYDWVRHTRVRLPDDARSIHILGKDMSDVDALQAEMLLIHLYGRSDHKYRKFDWKRGILQNKTDGADGAASSDFASNAAIADASFYEHNPNFTLKCHESGEYWYSDNYPEIMGKVGKWMRKMSPDQKKAIDRQPASPPYVPALTPLQQERLTRMGESVGLANARYDMSRFLPLPA